MPEPGPASAGEAAALVRASGLPVDEAQLAILVANYAAVRAQVERLYEVGLDDDEPPTAGAPGQGS